MSDINSIIFEDSSHTKDYMNLNKLINQANDSYNNAMIAHNNNDSNAFLKASENHTNVLNQLYSTLANPNCLANGKDYIKQRREKFLKNLNNNT